MWATADARWLVFLIALVVSGIVSWFLALAMSRPVRKLRDATVSLAGGNLGIRVDESVGRRRDEFGLLGRDFDKMAENLERAATRQAELSRNISHELRSPLARMRVAIEMARKNSEDVPELDRLDRETERLDELIGQILSYTKLDATPEQDPQLIELTDLLEEVVENVNYECKAGGIAGVSVSERLDASPKLLGHSEAIRSAIENVVRNAVHHSPSDSIVDVSLSQENGHALIEVRDSGPGVSADEIEQLFEPFFQTRASETSKENGGSGLGLAIAKRAVTLHGGSISAANQAGGGLLLRLRLPL